jgi:predicted ATPase
VRAMPSASPTSSAIHQACDRSFIALTHPVPSNGERRDNPGEMGGLLSSPTFIGRVEELRILEAARVRAANAEPAVVLLGGEAGVGKTRLLAELAARCRTDRMRMLTGGCLPVGGDELPYAPIVEALRPLPAELGVGTVRELAGPSWPELAGPSWPELARLLPALGEPRGGPPGEAAQAGLFEVLLGLLGRLGEQIPLVFVVEDLHWADRSTHNLLAFLVRNLRRERVLVVVSYRSDEPQTAWLGPYLAELDRGGPVERIELPRFERREVVAQLTAILGAMPAADLVDAVFARSEGNPLFSEELLAAVRAGSGTLPATLHDLLRGRVAGLPEAAHQVLEVAAVAGRRVPHQLLAAVAGLDERGLDRALRAAVAEQLLVTSPGEDAYQFRHALLQEVVYAGLLPGERARLHAALAAAIAAQPGLVGGIATTVARPSWPTTGRPPVSWGAPCRPRSRLAWPPRRRMPLPRPSGSTSVPCSCGIGCRERPSSLWSTGLPCSNGRPTPLT